VARHSGTEAGMKVHSSIESLEAGLRTLVTPPVVVVGLCSHGLAIVRTFARRGVPVYGIESDFRQPSARSRYGIKIACPSLYGPELLQTLNQIGERAARRPLLLVTNDKMVRLLNPHQRDLRERFHLPFPSRELLDRLIDKEPLAEHARSKGLRIPETRVVETTDDVRRAGSAITYPCIVKPAESMSAFKVLLVPDQAALVRTIESHPGVKRFVLQSWIAGGDESIFFTNYYFGQTGDLLASFAGQKIRQYPRLLGSASAARGVDRPDLLREGLRVFEGVGYRGFGSVEFKVDGAGQPYFIEATVGRTEYLVKTSLANGVDLLSAAYDDLALGKPACAGPQRNRRIWVDLDRDWEVYLESFLDPAIRKDDLVRFLFAPKALELFDAQDPAPFIAWLPHLAARASEKLVAKLAPRRTRVGSV